MSTLTERIDRFELDLRRMQRELEALRREALSSTRPPETVSDAPFVAEPPAVPAPPAHLAPQPPALLPEAFPPPAARRAPRPRIDVGELVARVDLLGARGLAIAGGAVTALGITLLFALATERGWIGPVERVAAGALVSSIVFGAGVLVHRRFGQYAAGLAAVGAGIAGGYATLAAATALYGLLPDAAALAIAAGIAGIAVAVALAWDAQLVAVLGLAGAALAPALEALGGQIEAIGLAFGTVVLAATAVLAIIRRWELLLASVLVIVAGEAAWLVAAAAPTTDAGMLCAVVAFAGVVLVAACAWQVTGGARALTRLAGPVVLGVLGFLLLSGHALLSGDQRSLWLAGAAGGFALCWIAVRQLQPDLALVVAACALALVAVALANGISGDGLTLAWAAESAVLSVLAYRFRDARLQLAALGYLALASAHLLAVTEPLPELFRRSGDASVALPTLGVAAAAAAAGLLAPVAYATTGEVGVLAFLGAARATLGRRRARIVEVLLAGATALAVVALGIVAVSFHLGAGHVVLSVAASLAAVAGTVIAPVRRSPGLAAASLVAAFLVTLEAAWFDFGELSAGWAGASLLVAAGGLLAAGILLRARWTTTDPLGLASGAAATAAFVGAFVALFVLVPDVDDLATRLWATGGSAAIAGVYLCAAAWALTRPRLRNLATTLWSLGLVGLLVAELAATDGGQAFAIAVAATAGMTALAGAWQREPRLWIAAATMLAIDCLAVLAALTPPEHFLTANAAPASGVVALLAVAAATVGLALTAPRRRRWILAGAAALALYAVSLVILGLAIEVFRAALETDFERGHTLVSALWGLTGLAVLVAGLARRSSELRYAGLALFGVTLAKIFLFDLSELSSIARAASFVAVGGLLLAGGLLVQRLGQRQGEILEQ